MDRSTRSQLEGNWKQIKGDIKRRWGELTDDDLTVAEGDLERLAGIIQKRTGQARADIERELERMGRR